MAGFGVVFAFATYWPLRFRGGLPVIISTIGASIFIENMVLVLYGPAAEPVDGLADVPRRVRISAVGQRWEGVELPFADRAHRL